jgi:hypothetical protein
MRSASASLKAIGYSNLVILRGSLAVKNRVFYLDGGKEPQAQG